jgi:adenylyl-sulfate kinase
MPRPAEHEKNIHPSGGHVPPAAREKLLGQRGCVVWLTGLSGSGKSTVARALEARLTAEGRLAYVLDGDGLRTGLNADLGFSPADRDENIRRVGCVAALLADAGLITIAAFISPYRAGRGRARAAVAAGRFVEVFLDTPLEVCVQRDPKGLYRKAHGGKLSQFTGIDAPYERPASPELRLDAAATPLDECVAAIHGYLADHGLLRPQGE